MSETQVKNMQINFSSQNFGRERNFFYTKIREGTRDLARVFLEDTEVFSRLLLVNCL